MAAATATPSFSGHRNTLSSPMVRTTPLKKGVVDNTHDVVEALVKFIFQTTKPCHLFRKIGGLTLLKQSLTLALLHFNS